MSAAGVRESGTALIPLLDTDGAAPFPKLTDRQDELLAELGEGRQITQGEVLFRLRDTGLRPTGRTREQRPGRSWLRCQRVRARPAGLARLDGELNVFTLRAARQTESFGSPRLRPGVPRVGQPRSVIWLLRAADVVRRRQAVSQRVVLLAGQRCSRLVQQIEG
jgi:hypothetical protein